MLTRTIENLLTSSCDREDSNDQQPGITTQKDCSSNGQEVRVQLELAGEIVHRGESGRAREAPAPRKLSFCSLLQQILLVSATGNRAFAKVYFQSLPRLRENPMFKSNTRGQFIIFDGEDTIRAAEFEQSRWRLYYGRDSKWICAGSQRLKKESA